MDYRGRPDEKPEWRRALQIRGAERKKRADGVESGCFPALEIHTWERVWEGVTAENVSTAGACRDEEIHTGTRQTGNSRRAATKCL